MCACSESRMRSNILPAIAMLISGIMAAAVAGCGNGPPQSAPVDASKARETLKAVLESWKAGEKPDSLQQRTPKIVVQDFDWIGGFRLLSYEIVGDGKSVDANLIATVKVTVQGPEASGPEEKSVTYVVGTSPVLTVFRDALN